MTPFFKYQGAGNDFIIIDDPENTFPLKDHDFIARLCDRHFGIGADGLILFKSSHTASYAFQMVYFNADGRESTMCGNGGRCIAQFALDQKKIEGTNAVFNAIDGLHEFEKSGENRIRLKMIDVKQIKQLDSFTLVLNTGSPHYITFCESVESIDVAREGRAIRNSKAFHKEGINVNFVAPVADGLTIRTYERGVEDETLACGTGITAAAIAAKYFQKIQHNFIPVKARGGNLSVSFEHVGDSFTNVWLEGPANFVFKGMI